MQVISDVTRKKVGDYAQLSQKQLVVNVISRKENDVTFGKGSSHRVDGMSILTKERMTELKETLSTTIIQAEVKDFGLCSYERVFVRVYRSLCIWIEKVIVRER